MSDNAVRRGFVANSHCTQAMSYNGAKRAVSVADQIVRRRIPANASVIWRAIHSAVASTTPRGRYGRRGSGGRRLSASGLDRAKVVHRPQLLSDNGPSYISADLAEWLDKRVGPMVALTFRTAVKVPARFKNSKTVGVVFGLTPCRHQSGEIDRMGGISKCGDAMIRTTASNRR